MSKIFLRCLFFVILFPSLNLYATIIESDNLEDVYKYVDQDSLVVFDIDNTIAIVSMGIEPWVKHKTDKLVKKGLNRKEAFHFVLSMFFLISKFTTLLPTENSPEVICNLQKKVIPVIALTKRGFPVCKPTVKGLKDIGIDLSHNGLLEKDLDLAVTHIGKFSHGIIFAGSNDKGKMLFLFFKKINYAPKKIVFVDDGMHQVESVQKACKEHKIPFVGMRFSLMDKMKKEFRLPEAEKIIHQLKIKAGFEPLGSTMSDEQSEKISCVQYIWNGITWPFRKLKDLFS